MKPETKAGFDACTALNGCLFVFQFKASNIITNRGARRFAAPHNQMEKLQGICGGIRGVVYYVFPLIGNTEELAADPYILDNTYLLDVAYLPNPMGQPATRTGTLRRSGNHYVDVIPPTALIHSKTIEVTLIKAKEVALKITNLQGIMPNF